MVDYLEKVHIPAHSEIKSNDTASGPNGQNPGSVVRGHLVTLKSREGEEKVFFLDPQGNLHPVIGAQFTPVVKVS